jgi:hypothetical protein
MFADRLAHPEADVDGASSKPQSTLSCYFAAAIERLDLPNCVEKNWRHSLSRISGGMPVPLSCILTSTAFRSVGRCDAQHRAQVQEGGHLALRMMAQNTGSGNQWR